MGLQRLLPRQALRPNVAAALLRAHGESQEQRLRLLPNARRAFVATGRIEASFASKLYATLHPNAPVIDTVVLENLGLRLQSATVPKRLDKVVNIHNCLTKTFANLLATEDGKYLVQSFRAAYPKASVTDEKALELVIWQIR